MTRSFSVGATNSCRFLPHSCAIGGLQQTISRSPGCSGEVVSIRFLASDKDRCKVRYSTRARITINQGVVRAFEPDLAGELRSNSGRWVRRTDTLISLSRFQQHLNGTIKVSKRDFDAAGEFSEWQPVGDKSVRADKSTLMQRDGLLPHVRAAQAAQY